MKQYIMKNNFSVGELAPTLYTRTDIQQYANGAKTLRNVIPLVEGGVHGDIRHLENFNKDGCSLYQVHGDIRHLEISGFISLQFALVHGDIRHLERDLQEIAFHHLVHGDIRHLEN